MPEPSNQNDTTIKPWSSIVTRLKRILWAKPIPDSQRDDAKQCRRRPASYLISGEKCRDAREMFRLFTLYSHSDIPRPMSRGETSLDDEIKKRMTIGALPGGNGK